MGLLIDTSVLVRAERSGLDLAALRGPLGREEARLSAVTASELIHGVHRARGEEVRRHREAFVEGVLRAIPIVPFDLEAARVHARIWADIAASGVTVGAHDLLIGASAISIGYGVWTENLRDFKRVPGLRVVG